MAGVNIGITIDAAAPAAALEEAAERAADLRPALRTIGRLGVNQTRRRFQGGVDPNGKTWVKGRKTSGQTLILKGLLLRSIHETEPDQSGVEWGSNLRYARIHQEGGTILPKTAGGRLTFKVAGGWVSVKKVTIPARPYLGVNADNLRAFGDAVVRYITEPLGGAATWSEQT